MKIAFSHRPSFFLDHLSAALREALAGHEFLIWKAGEPAPAPDIEVLLVVGALDRERIADQRKLFFIQTTSAGYDGIDIDAATELGIWVSAAPSGETGNAVSVAEWALMLMIASSRRLGEALASLPDSKRSGEHDPKRSSDHINTSLAGKSVCIVGLGAIGRRLADRLRPFEMRIGGTDEHPENAPEGVTAYPTAKLHAALSDADYVVICAPGTAENENLIGAEAIAAMKRGAIVVNVSRGTLVDEDALAAAVADGRLAAAGLDVVKHEPVEEGNPLLRAPNVFLTPHIAGATDLMLEGTVRFVAGVVDDLTAGRLPKAVLNKPANARKHLA